MTYGDDEIEVMKTVVDSNDASGNLYTDSSGNEINQSDDS